MSQSQFTPAPTTPAQAEGVKFNALYERLRGSGVGADELPDACRFIERWLKRRERAGVLQRGSARDIRQEVIHDILDAALTRNATYESPIAVAKTILRRQFADYVADERRSAGREPRIDIKEPNHPPFQSMQACAACYEPHLTTDWYMIWERYHPQKGLIECAAAHEDRIRRETRNRSKMVKHEGTWKYSQDRLNHLYEVQGFAAYMRQQRYCFLSDVVQDAWTYQLTDKERLAIHHYHVLGTGNYSDVAAACGVSPRTICSWLSSATKKIEGIVAPYLEKPKAGNSAALQIAAQPRKTYEPPPQPTRPTLKPSLRGGLAGLVRARSEPVTATVKLAAPVAIEAVPAAEAVAL